mgnify:CR=1 FL=1
MQRAIALIIFVVLVVASIFYFNSEKNSNYVFNQKIIVKNVPIKVAIVDTEDERASGLSNRRPLKRDEALFFVFESPGLYGIWMKEMNFSIDVIWFDENLKVVFVKENFSPESYPEVAYPSVKALYVLETQAGLAEEHAISIGDELKISK